MTNLNYTNSSWFPLWKFTNSECHKDHMLGVSKWRCKDFLFPKETIKPDTTVIWNRTLGNISISYENYKKAVESKDKDLIDKMKSILLPCDLNIN